MIKALRRLWSNVLEDIGSLRIAADGKLRGWVVADFALIVLGSMLLISWVRAGCTVEALQALGSQYITYLTLAGGGMAIKSLKGGIRDTLK